MEIGDDEEQESDKELEMLDQTSRDRPPHQPSVGFWQKRITNIKTNLPEPRPLREELELSGRNDSVHQGQKHVGDNKCFVFNIQFVGGIDNER